MTLEIRVLGPVQVVGTGGVFVLPAKQRRLLAALVIAAPTARSSDSLIDLVWPDGPPASAHNLLQVYVSQLRKAISDIGTIERRGAGYTLVANADAVDVTRFESLVAQARGAVEDGAAFAASLLRRALGLWRGRAYEDFADDEFARAEAQRLEDLRLTCAEALFEAELALGHHLQVVPELQSAAAAEPLRERLQEQLILALYRCGRQTDALDVYRSLHNTLRDELGIDPSPRLRELQQQVLQHDARLDLSSPMPAPAHSLPTPADSLIGRERELAELHELVHHVRLLVLTGAGGSGKTRLALEVAHLVRESFADGAVFVDLAPVHDPQLVLPTIADKLGIKQVRGDPVEALIAALRGRELLLVIDNAEHLREAAPQYSQLLAGAPHLTLLVTSRTVLHLSGEHVYPVEPLLLDVAVQLFLQRAREREPRLELSADDEAAVPRICERLDGLPLAVELAAARVAMLTPAEILARLESRLPLLAGGPRDLPARQQTLEATVAWSYGLLGAEEKRDMRRLAVFAGGCTFEAAEAVCETTVDRLAALVDDNLVRRATVAGQSRYTMLETIREQATALLTDSEVTAARDAHARYFINLAERAYAERLERSAYWLPQLETEHANLRAALDWLTQSQPAKALQLAGALGWFWAYRGHFLEGHRRLHVALATDCGTDTDRARALVMGAQLLNAQGDLAAAREWGEQGAVLAEILGDPAIAAPAFVILAAVCTHQNELDRARELNEKGLKYATQLPATPLTARALGGLCYVLVCGGEAEAARTKAEELLEHGRLHADQVAEMQGHHYLGDCALQQADCAAAEEHYRNALAMAWQLGHTNQAQTELIGLAMALAGQSKSYEALRIEAAVKSHRANENVLPSVPFWEKLQERYLGAAPDALGEETAADAWREGESLSIENLVAQMLATSKPVS